MIGALRWTSLVGTSNFYRKQTLTFRKVNPLRFNAANIVRTNMHMRKISDRLHNQLRTKDKVSDDYILIYRSPSYNYITSTQLGLSLVIPIEICSILYVIFQYPYVQFPLQITTDFFFEDSFQLILFCSVLVWTTFVLSRMCSRFPLRIYHNEKTKLYKAILVSRIPFQRITVQFSEGTAVKKREFLEYFVPWLTHKYFINNRPLFLVDCNFRSSSDFFQMIKEEKV